MFYLEPTDRCYAFTVNVVDLTGAWTGGNTNNLVQYIFVNIPVVHLVMNLTGDTFCLAVRSFSSKTNVATNYVFCQVD